MFQYSKDALIKESSQGGKNYAVAAVPTALGTNNIKKLPLFLPLVWV